MKYLDCYTRVSTAEQKTEGSSLTVQEDIGKRVAKKLGFKFPVIKYPEKVKSVGLDKHPYIEEKLVGIKGQYLLFDNDTVFNMRKHTGYLIELSY